MCILQASKAVALGRKRSYISVSPKTPEVNLFVCDTHVLKQIQFSVVTFFSSVITSETKQRLHHAG